MSAKHTRFILSSLFVAAGIFLSAFNADAQNKYEDSYNYQRGLEALNNSGHSTGIDYLNKEIAAHKDNGYAYFYLAVTYQYYEDSGRALSNINNALKNLPKKDKYMVSYAYRVRADIYDEIGQTVLSRLGRVEIDYTHSVLRITTKKEKK